MTVILYAINKIKMEQGYQDGRLGGCGAHLCSPTHQKFIYMWNNSNGKLTRNWKNFCTMKVTRNNWVRWKK